MSNQRVASLTWQSGEGPPGTAESTHARNGTTSTVIATTEPDAVGPETHLTLYRGGSWWTAAVPGEAITFVHPDTSGRHLLVQHRNDRWTMSAT
jgi:hypothetical protein